MRGLQDVCFFLSFFFFFFPRQSDCSQGRMEKNADVKGSLSTCFVRAERRGGRKAKGKRRSQGGGVLWGSWSAIMLSISKSDFDSRVCTYSKGNRYFKSFNSFRVTQTWDVSANPTSPSAVSTNLHSSPSSPRPLQNNHHLEPSTSLPMYLQSVQTLGRQELLNLHVR